MAKKSTVKVRLVPEEKTDSKFYYYAKKPTSGLKAKDKLRMKKCLLSKTHTLSIKLTCAQTWINKIYFPP